MARQPARPATFIDRSLKRVARRDLSDWRPSSQVSLARRIARFGIGGYDALYALPGTADLLGRDVAEFSRRAGTLRVALAAPEAFVDPGDRETLPLYTRARVFGRVAKPFAVVVNGRIVATTRSYQERGSSVLSTMIPEGALAARPERGRDLLIDRTGARPRWSRRFPECASCVLEQVSAIFGPLRHRAASDGINARVAGTERRSRDRPVRWVDEARRPPVRPTVGRFRPARSVASARRP